MSLGNVLSASAADKRVSFLSEVDQVKTCRVVCVCVSVATIYLFHICRTFT